MPGLPEAGLGTRTVSLYLFLLGVGATEATVAALRPLLSPSLSRTQTQALDSKLQHEGHAKQQFFSMTHSFCKGDQAFDHLHILPSRLILSHQRKYSGGVVAGLHSSSLGVRHPEHVLVHPLRSCDGLLGHGMSRMLPPTGAFGTRNGRLPPAIPETALQMGAVRPWAMDGCRLPTACMPRDTIRGADPIRSPSV